MELEESINYIFKNKNFLETALTHKSYANDNNVESYEKFEFLGDSILEFVASKYLYINYPNLKEGELTKVRAQIVCEDSLYEIAKRHNIPKYIKLGNCEYAINGHAVKSISADIIEALIAAIYFDSGIENAEKFIIDNLKDTIEVASKNIGNKDYKTVLQEKMQIHGNANIEYKILNEIGPDHNKTFISQVSVNGKILAKGEGKTKKEAEMQAARKALNMEENNL